MLITSAVAAGESFRFQGRVDVVSARPAVVSSEEIREACTLENRQTDSTSPQIRGTQEADPGAKQPEGLFFSAISPRETPP